MSQNATEVAEVSVRPLLVSARDAARCLGIGRTMLYELIKAGEITPVHIGRCVRFSVHELESYVDGLLGFEPPEPVERPQRRPRQRVTRSADGEPTLF